MKQGILDPHYSPLLSCDTLSILTFNPQFYNHIKNNEKILDASEGMIVKQGNPQYFPLLSCDTLSILTFNIQFHIKNNEKILDASEGIIVKQGNPQYSPLLSCDVFNFSYSVPH